VEAEPEIAASPAAVLAQQLREALAANTIGGRGEADGRRRTVEQEVRQLQAAWGGVGYVPDSLAGPLADRFRRALRRAAEPRDRRTLVGR
jgi:hypothetical protein